MITTTVFVFALSAVALLSILLAVLITSMRVKGRMVEKAAFDQQAAILSNKADELLLIQERHTQATALLERAEAELQRQKQIIDQRARDFIELNNDHSRRKAELDNAFKQSDLLTDQLSQASTAFDQLKVQWQQEVKQATHWKSQTEMLQNTLAEQQKTMQDFSQQMKREFSLLADQVLAAKANQFNQQQETKLNDLLAPLKEKLDTFKKEISDSISTESRHRSGLQAEVKLMADLNRQLSQQADSLTKALTTNVKQQGNWGETILETILQYAGLQKDIHYVLQHTATNAEGQTIRPDCIVRYPDERYVVIDSKVSLLHYKQFTEAANDEEQIMAMRQMLRSMRQHIEGLTGKRYDSVPGVLDYVFMFVPVEAAFITAMQHDGQLWQYAFDRKILLVSPTLLISGIKLIHELWRQDNVNKNAEAIAEKAGGLYDKLHGFLQNFDDIGKKLEMAQASFSSADKQLRNGRGNLIKRAQDIKTLGARANKQLDAPAPAYDEEDTADDES